MCVFDRSESAGSSETEAVQCRAADGDDETQKALLKWIASEAFDDAVRAATQAAGHTVHPEAVLAIGLGEISISTSTGSV